MLPRPALLLVPLLALVPRGPQEGADAQDFDAGFASITEKELLVHVTELSAPQLEGRDSPSTGLHMAGEYIIERLKAAGVDPGHGESYRMTYTVQREAPVASGCELTFKPEDGAAVTLTLGEDYVPFPGCNGQGEGKLVFFGFGITESGERYDDLRGKNCRGDVAMVLESEPRHRRYFAGPDEITKAADAYTKIKDLENAGARAVLLVRRSPPEEAKGFDGRSIPLAPLGFRHTWARWNYPGPQAKREVNAEIPVLELTEAAASRLLGEDVKELAEKIDSSGKPVKIDKETRVTVAAETSEQPVPIDNIVGLVEGTDETLAREYVVLGAHYDHIGVDSWGRVGCGADDNGSGSAGLIEIAEAMVLAKPRRSVLIAWFSAEEDGLVGSEEFCDRPPVSTDAMVAMINVDMIGRCEENEVYVVGTKQNPAFEDILKDAKKLKNPQLKKIHTDKAQDLWTRSDHYNFHQKGVPAIFFTEGAVDAENEDYHVFTDTVEKLSLKKMGKITRLMFNTAWLVANEDEPPPDPE